MLQRRPTPTSNAGRSPAAGQPEGEEAAGPEAGALLTPAEAAKLLRVTEGVLERWRSSGEGPPFVRLSRKTIRYTPEDLRAFVAARRAASTAA